MISTDFLREMTVLVTVYGHIHQQFLRYGTTQLIINPGSLVKVILDSALRQDSYHAIL